MHPRRLNRGCKLERLVYEIRDLRFTGCHQNDNQGGYALVYDNCQDCPNGRLTPAKFVDMYKMFFPSGNAEEFCDHVFRTFDMDKNGYIDFKVSA
ncbi:hypothetical protein M8J75_012361 [Diaphorina citri]|nr:hypothetical protein M8J75_012361 [Diaphorina citri]